jgi:eukaryotic-like serine/threonine-protein kinase
MDRSGAALPAAVGQYAMYGQIGAGGMATVHLGRGPAGEVVAIKRLRPHLTNEPDVVKSFLDEARLSARVVHPNVVATREVVTHDGEVFLIMEYIEGVSLAHLLRNQGAGALPVSADLVAAIVSDVLRGLHAAHEAVSEAGEPLHIVHRDVSPQNILIGVDGTARVLDFGVAKALGRHQTTRDGKIKGKLGYMAPEQLHGRGVTRRTDIFAAGIVLWEALTGERLFQTDDEATTVTRVLMERVRPPSDVCARAPAALDQVVLRALERDPSRRFLTADDMARALNAALAPADPETVTRRVKIVAADEIARRAGLMRADAPPPVDRGLPNDTDIDVLRPSNHSAPAFASSRPGSPVRRVPVLVGGAVIVAIAVWGAISLSRTKATLTPADALALPTPPPSVVETSPPPSASAALPAPAPGETALAAPSSAPSSGKAPARHVSPKPAPSKAPASVRERLYSRD